MATATVENAVVERILRAYNLPFAEILPVQKGYRNQSFPVLLQDGRTVNLILYKSEPGILEKIKAANAVADFLAARGFPVRRTLTPKIIRLQTGAHVKYGALYNYLDGHTIPWEAYTQDHIKLLGKTMSDMHGTLAECGAALPSVAAEYEAIVARMRAYFAQKPVQKALAQKLHLRIDSVVFGRFEKILSLSGKLPAQALHMDFVRSNILFVDEPGGDLAVAISGILDFEKASSGSKIFDVARTLAFLLVDCKYKTPEQVRKYFLRSGYQKRGPAGLNSNELRLLEPLLNLFLFYDFYKFLRHNPYEFLPQNEHFVRTLALLREKRLF